MERLTIAVHVLLGVFVAFNVFIFFLTNEHKPKIGLLDIISNSVKVLKGPWVILFSVFALGLAGPLALFLEVSGWFFIPMACLALLAAAPLFPDSSKRHTSMHLIGAIGPILSILVLIWIFYGHWWGLPELGIVAIALKQPRLSFGYVTLGKARFITEGIFIRYRPVKNYTTWIEFAAFAIIITELYIR